jgi:hypothetical protein
MDHINKKLRLALNLRGRYNFTDQITVKISHATNERHVDLKEISNI